MHCLRSPTRPTIWHNQPQPRSSLSLGPTHLRVLAREKGWAAVSELARPLCPGGTTALVSDPSVVLLRGLTVPSKGGGSSKASSEVVLPIVSRAQLVMASCPTLVDVLWSRGSLSLLKEVHVTQLCRVTMPVLWGQSMQLPCTGVLRHGLASTSWVHAADGAMRRHAHPRMPWLPAACSRACCRWARLGLACLCQAAGAHLWGPKECEEDRELPEAVEVKLSMRPQGLSPAGQSHVQGQQGDACWWDACWGDAF